MQKHFKMVEIRPGHYRSVPLTDPRPEVILPNKPGIPFTVTTPPWAAYEAAVHNQDATPEQQRTATDQFIAEREKWTSSSTKYRKWEEQRKGEWAKHKPAWRKKMAEKGVV